MKQDTAAIRRALRKRGFTGSVTRGRGTDSAWTHIRGSGVYGEFTGTERDILRSVDIVMESGNYASVAPEEHAALIARLEGREPDPEGVRHMELTQKSRR